MGYGFAAMTLQLNPFTPIHRCSIYILESVRKPEV